MVRSLTIAMIRGYEIFRSLKTLHRLREQDPIEEELRGWNFSRPPVKPRAYLGLRVHEVAYAYCPTKRDVYLRRMGVSERPNRYIIEGSIVHKIFYAVNIDVRKKLSGSAKPWEAYEHMSSNAVNRLISLGINVEKESWSLDLYKLLAFHKLSTCLLYTSPSPRDRG